MRDEDLRKLTNCWLSPTGKVKIGHNIGLSSTHISLAWEILATKAKKTVDELFLEMIKNNAPNHQRPDYILEDMGWVKLQDVLGEPRWVIQQFKKLTKKQQRFILDWCLANNVSYNDMMERAYV